MTPPWPPPDTGSHWLWQWGNIRAHDVVEVLATDPTAGVHIHGAITDQWVSLADFWANATPPTPKRCR
jgi:hypothetical protein